MSFTRPTTERWIETVAIKILRQQPFDDPSLTQRFLAEIKLARRVTHKNVCRIHDYGQAASVTCNKVR